MTITDPVIGLFLPVLIDFINKKVTDTKARYVISLVTCLVVALLVNWQEFVNKDVGAVLASAGTIFVTATSVYKLYWEQSTLRSKITR